jgi:hypothetical protein
MLLDYYGNGSDTRRDEKKGIHTRTKEFTNIFPFAIRK